MAKNSAWAPLVLLQPLLVVGNAHAQPQLADAMGSADPWLEGQETSLDDGTLRRGPTALTWSGRGATLSLGGYMRTSLVGRREISGLVLLQVPLDRLFGREPFVAQGDASSAQRQEGSPEVTEPPARSPRAVPTASWMPDLARRCVRAAWRVHGLDSTDRLDSMRSRARTSAVLPEARFRYARGWDQSFRLTPTDEDPYRLQETNGGSRWLEGRLTWRLDRLLFAEEEIPIERLREQRVQMRAKVAGEVLRVLFAWHRARWTASDPALDEAERMEQLLREQEAAATLDVLTNGWFSTWLAAGPAAIKTPQPPAP